MPSHFRALKAWIWSLARCSTSNPTSDSSIRKAGTAPFSPWSPPKITGQIRRSKRGTAWNSCNKTPMRIQPQALMISQAQPPARSGNSHLQVQWHSVTPPCPRTSAKPHAAPAAKDCHIGTLEHNDAATHNDHRKPQQARKMLRSFFSVASDDLYRGAHFEKHLCCQDSGQQILPSLKKGGEREPGGEHLSITTRPLIMITANLSKQGKCSDPFSPWPVTIYIEVRTSKNISAVRILDSRFCQMKCELHPEPMMSLAVMCSQRSKSQKTTLVNSVLGAHWENVELKNQG